MPTSYLPWPQVAWVPGSFELPVLAAAMAKSGQYDAVITVGAVVRAGLSACCSRHAIASDTASRVCVHAVACYCSSAAGSVFRRVAATEHWEHLFHTQKRDQTSQASMWQSRG